MESLQVAQIVSFIDLVGVFANAVLGGVIARFARLDLIGFCAIAMVSGLGGGVIRDTLLQAGPPVALTNLAYVQVAVLGALVAHLVPIRGKAWDRSLAVADALALGCWTVAGTTKTLGVGMGMVAAVLLGITTAVGGGALRDVLLQRVPAVFGGNTLYATASLAGSLTMIAFWQLDQPTLGTVVAIIVGAGLCLVARWRGWMLPEGYSWRLPRVGQVLPRPRWVGALLRGGRRAKRSSTRGESRQRAGKY